MEMSRKGRNEGIEIEVDGNMSWGLEIACTIYYTIYYTDQLFVLYFDRSEEVTYPLKFPRPILPI